MRISKTTFLAVGVIWIGYMALSVPSARAETIELGGKEIPAEKFHVFFVFGDSNTWGSANAEDDWSNPRAWMMGRKGEWLPAECNVPHARPKVGPEPDWTKGRSGTAWWMLKFLTKQYPEDYFGVVNFGRAGGFGEGLQPGTALDRYDQYMDFVSPYAGQFHLIGIIMESAIYPPEDQLKALAQWRERLREDLGVERIPLAFSPWRLNAYNAGGGHVWDIRGTKELFPDYEKFAGLDYRPIGWLGVVGAGTFVQAAEDVAIVYGFNLGMQDNRHAFGLSKNGQWGHDEFNKRFFYALVANGWALPGQKPDTERPTAPANVRTENLWDEGVTLSWDEGRDNLAVRGYEVFANGQKVPWWPTLPSDLPMVTSALPRFPVSGLKPDTEYELKVRTVDYANNRSPFTEPVRVRTEAEPRIMQPPVRINMGGPAAGDWLADKEFRDGGGYGLVLSPGGHFPETERAKGLREIFVQDSPERTVFGWYRRSSNAYKFRVPNGKYRLTWYHRPNPWEYGAHEGDTAADGYDIEDKGPEGFEVTRFPEGSPMAAAFNPDNPNGRLGRAFTVTVTVTDGALVAWPMNKRSVGHSGMDLYAVTLELAE
jgi:hypothetical protein